MDAALKRWPCARPLHAALAAIDELRTAGHAIAPGDGVLIALPSPLLGFVTAEARPAGAPEAAASALVAVAGALAGRASDPSWYREVGSGAARLPEVSVELGTTPQLDAAFPERWGAEVTLVSSGERVCRQVMVAPGDPSLPLSNEEVLDKAARLTGLRPASPELEALLTLAQTRDVTVLWRDLQAALWAR
jgi:2-methylcitrate dehydratase PrpD